MGGEGRQVWVVRGDSVGGKEEVTGVSGEEVIVSVVRG